MNPKTCDTMMDLFFSLDKDERFPARLTMHLLLCQQCRTQVRLLTIAEKVCATPLTRPSSEESLTELINTIRLELPGFQDIRPISLRKWIVSGILMILAMLLFAFVSPQSSGNYLQLAFYLVFAGIVTTYCAFFIAGNMDFFVKKIETIRAV